MEGKVLENSKRGAKTNTPKYLTFQLNKNLRQRRSVTWLP